MKIYFHRFWGGFFDQTNPVDVRFFIELFTKVFEEPCEIGDIDTSDTLCETVYSSSALDLKQWKKTILFSGESKRSHIDTNLYTLVLCGERNHNNIINCPLFIPFLWCKNSISSLENRPSITDVPPQSIVAIISNSNGEIRNQLLDSIEKAGISIAYGGSHRNNIGFKFPGEYGSDDFITFISNFKFVISMENSQDDTYITEKICSGFLANTIPIYWGSLRVGDYFNPERFIHMDDKNPEEAISKIKYLESNPEAWLSMVNKDIFTGKTLWRTMDDIARDCKAVLYPSPLFPHIQQIYFLCSPIHEYDKYQRLLYMIQQLGLKDYMYTFLAPTWGTTISPDTYSYHVRRMFRDMFSWWHGPEGLKYSSLSLILNYKALFEDSVKRYAPSACIVSFESDVLPLHNTLYNLPNFLNFCYSNRQTWGCIHFGYGSKCRDDDGREVVSTNGTFSLISHINTRCTDTMIWKTSSIQAILEYMNETEEYSEPIDHYLSRYFETRAPLMNTWSSHVFFKQSSNYLDYGPGAELCPKHQAECHIEGEVPLRQRGQ